MTDNLKIVFEELASRVGTSLDKIDFTNADWFAKHKWTVQEELDFKDWLIEQLKSNPQLVDDLEAEGIVRRDIKEMAMDFVIFYGWDFKKINQ